ncbi:MAG: hypothetical protein ACI9VR_003050 [Cognaticolwellia sp.]|jgi:hypothetical protein
MSMVLLLLACGQSTDAQRLAKAMDPKVSLPRALRGCQDIADMHAQGDCLTAALELRPGTDLRDCQQIESRRWRNECVFVLAERLAETDLDGAISLCAKSSYVRECLFHLIRDVAQGVTELSPGEAEVFIDPFIGVPRTPDSVSLFWKEWVRHRVRTMDRPVPEALCEGLQDSPGCEKGLTKARKEMLRGVPSAKRCSRAAEERPLIQLEDGSRALVLSAMEMEEIRRTCAARKR